MDDQNIAKESDKPYYSADNIHQDKNDSKESVIRKTLEKLNMAPASRKEGFKSQNQLIQKLSHSIAALIDDSTSPSEFNHVREGIIMQKITDISSSRAALLDKDDPNEEKTSYEQISEEENIDIENLLSITHKSRDPAIIHNTGITSPKDREKYCQKKELWK